MDLWSVNASRVVVLENCRPLILNEFSFESEKIFLHGKKEKKDCYQYRYQTRYASAEADDCFLVEMGKVALVQVAQLSFKV